jgi:hypothetical protein
VEVRVAIAVVPSISESLFDEHLQPVLTPAQVARIAARGRTRPSTPSTWRPPWRWKMLTSAPPAAS